MYFPPRRCRGVPCWGVPLCSLWHHVNKTSCRPGEPDPCPLSQPLWERSRWIHGEIPTDKQIMRPVKDDPNHVWRDNSGFIKAGYYFHCANRQFSRWLRDRPWLYQDELLRSFVKSQNIILRHLALETSQLFLKCLTFYATGSLPVHSDIGEKEISQ